MSKIALVTGASRGIGAAIADYLAVDGFTVIGTATTEAGATDITNRFLAAGHAGQGMLLNVADLESIESTLKAIEQAFGAPLVVVNNAGITRDNLFLRMKETEWQDVLSTNLTGAYRVSRACIKAMVKARWGRIINIGSVVASSGNPGQANYCAAKAGLIGLSKSLAQEIGSRGITVNVVAPGFIESDMTDALSEEQKVALIKGIPLGRMGAPKDIAEVVRFLASEKASYITGQTIHVNGGMYMS